MPSWLLYCRAGFENECAAEIQTRALEQHIHGYCKTRPDSGYVVYTAPEPDVDLFAVLHLDDLIFTRQWFVIVELLNDLPLADRLSPIMRVLQDEALDYSTFFLETPDTNTGKELQKLCRALANPLQRELEIGDCIARSRHIACIFVSFPPMRRTSAMHHWRTVHAG